MKLSTAGRPSHILAGVRSSLVGRRVREVGAPGRLPVAPSGGRPSHRAVIGRVLIVTDALAATLGVTAGLVLLDPDGRADAQIATALAAVPVLLLLLKVYGLYDRDAKRVSSPTVDEVPGTFHAVLIWTLVLWAALKVLTDDRLVLAQAAAIIALVLVGVLGLRVAARRAVRRLAAAERVVVVGGGTEAALLVRKIHAHPEYAVDVIGYVADASSDRRLLGRVPWLGPVPKVRDVSREHRAERVIMAEPSLDDERLTALVRGLTDASVKVSVVPHVVDVLGTATELDDIEGMTVLGISPPRLSASSRALKRGLDLVVSGAGLVVLAPLLPLAALAIRLDSPGPVFFGHERLGRDGRRFRLFKLRTMVVDAEAQADELRERSLHPAWLHLTRDPRVTRVGSVLRRTSLDELPQLWNVLRGEMSLVGPRPMPPDVDRHITGWGRRRLELTPGLTGLWQVLGRTAIPFEEMIKLDYVYVTNWSLWSDIRLLLRTAWVVLSRRGAN
jgi:exopolysaccharide biosynthesis polyprenyl glycosylphosphotransferase